MPDIDADVCGRAIVYPREAEQLAAQERREAAYEENQKRMRALTKAERLLGLKDAVAVASLKRGKPRKVKK